MSDTTTTLLLRSTLLFVFLAPPLIGAPAPLPGNRGYFIPNTLPNGVADPGGKIGYFLAKGGLEAVDLETGRVIWKTEGTAYPLAVWRRHVVVAMPAKSEDDKFHVVVLDGDGLSSLESKEIKVAGYRRGSKGRLVIRSFLNGDELLLDWWIAWRTSDVPKQPFLRHSGIARVNLRTGEVAEVSEEQRLSLRPPFHWVEKVEEQLKTLPKDVHFLDGPCWDTSKPQRLIDGNRLAVVWRTKDGSNERLTLRTWDVSTGEDIQTTKLLLREYGLHLRPSDDGRYLFFQHERKKISGWRYGHTWEVYRVATGKHLGTFLHDGFTIKAGVAGDRIFVIEESTEADGRAGTPQLHVWDLKTGKRLWKRPAAVNSIGLPLGS